MKKLILLLGIFIYATSATMAQDANQEMGLIGSILKSEIKVFFAQNIELKTTETEQFWEIYDQFENEVKPISIQRFKLLENIINKGGELTQDDLDNKIVTLNKSQDKRRKVRFKYYKIYKKKLGVKVASQFYQIDSYISTRIAASLNEGMPIILPKD
ncbi:MAG: hypothetical protein N4A71_08965 [Carboxylicivirga sp.]|jgi:hypothetical protein|nr:hypothetical protein [Carboxylicivirga sp.]